MSNGCMSPEQVVDQFQQILGALKKIVEASATTAGRVEALESRSGDLLGALTSIQGNLQMLLETYQGQAESQSDLNQEVSRRLASLEAKVATLSGGTSP